MTGKHVGTTSPAAAAVEMRDHLAAPMTEPGTGKHRGPLRRSGANAETHAINAVPDRAHDPSRVAGSTDKPLRDLPSDFYAMHPAAQAHAWTQANSEH